MTQPYENHTYYGLALDPIHIGTGGYRLGRVDLSIVREPGTHLPKLPGTSLSGACRAYTAMVWGRYDWTANGKRGSCAGQGVEREQPNKAGHCGKPYCPVCVAFGFARGDSGGFQGLAQFADARLLFFPVHSLIGPVWITSPTLLSEHRSTGASATETTVSPDKVRLVNGLSAPNGRLNLGWLMLQSEGVFDLSGYTLPDELAPIKARAVLVSDKLFSQLVNDNLEVRTSVSIDPATGAAQEGALFTYEALPRGTVVWFPITYNDRRFFRIGGTEPNPRAKVASNGELLTDDEQENRQVTVKEVVERGLALFEHLGIGGMNTRGLGRLRVLGLNASAANIGQPVATQTQAGGPA